MKVKHSGPTRDFLLLMEDYHGSFTDAYRADPSLGALPYEECSKRLFSRPIYYGDAYVNSLTSRGFLAEQVVPLCLPLQFKWTGNTPGAWNPRRWMAGLPGNSYP